LPVLEPGQDWTQAQGEFELPLVTGASIVDGIGRKVRDLTASTINLKLSLAPVFVRGLDAAKMQLKAPAPNPHFLPSKIGLSREQHVFLQALTRPSQPRLAHDEAQKQKNALICADGQTEELALIVHNYTEESAAVSVALWLPQGWSLDAILPPAGCESSGMVVPLVVAPQSTVEIRARYTAAGLKTDEECVVTGQLYLNGAPRDQVAVYYKGI